MTANPSRLAFLCSALLFGVTLLSSCAGSEVEVPQPSFDQPLRIVSSFPVKGASAAESQQIIQGIDLAISEHSTTPGKLKFEHVKMDDGSDENGAWSPSKESHNAERAVADPQVLAYIGPYTSGAMGVALPITNRAHLLTLGPTATWPGLTLDGWERGEPQKYYPVEPRNFARIALPDSRQAEAAARWAIQVGSKGIYVLNDGSSYSEGLAAQFIATSSEICLDVVGQKSIGQFGGAELMASHADAIFFAPSNAAAAVKLATLLRAVTSKPNVFVTDTALSDLFLNEAENMVSTWHFTFNGSTVTPKADESTNFANSFLARFGAQPLQGAARAYDLTNLVLDAAESLQTPRRETITVKVMKTKNYKGVSGNISFDENGDLVTANIEGYLVRDGKFVLDRAIRW